MNRLDAIFEELERYHFDHTNNSGTTAFVAKELDVIVISCPETRNRLREMFAAAGILDFPEVSINGNTGAVFEANVPKLRKREA